MSYFDDIENYRYRTLRCYNLTQRVHYTQEPFVQDTDGRFQMRNTVCGLVFSQSSGRVVRRKSKITCKKCLKYDTIS